MTSGHESFVRPFVGGRRFRPEPNDACRRTHARKPTRSPRGPVGFSRQVRGRLSCLAQGDAWPPVRRLPSGVSGGGPAVIDLDRLLKLRLVVARHGEMDRAAWWNTRGMLGRHGAIALMRGLPRTHGFAQARVVFTVARSRCHELFDPPGAVTLWKLPAELEDQFNERWHTWLAESEEWNELFDRLAASTDPDLLSELSLGGLISSSEIEQVQAMRRSAEGRAVQVPGEQPLDDGVLTLLAAGFAKGEQGAPAIPYARLAE